MLGTGEVSDALTEVKKLCRHLGYDLTLAGENAATISLQSDYTVAETASFLLLACLAWDVRKHFIQAFDPEKTVLLAQHGLEALKILRSLAETGNIRKEIWESDARAIATVTAMDSRSAGMIERVLADPTVSISRVGESRIL